jgi:hypothetical protein
MTKWLFLETIFTIFAVFLGVFLLNVYTHEIGHYVVADAFGLEPKITMEPLRDGLSFTAEPKPLAYTEFNKTESDFELILIAIAGPIVNLLITIIFLIVYVNYKHNVRIQNIALAGLVPSLFSFVINIIPYSTTDGMMILQALL